MTKTSANTAYSPIGVFDSGYGGLTVLKEIVKTLPQYDYLYLGDNARAPYGSRSFETVYEYTLECVMHLFDKGCELVIVACNTASAKALRTIQQKDLPNIDPSKRVLGVIRPTTEIVGNYSKTGHVGLFATQGTVNSLSYLIEIGKFFPGLKVFQEACPMWVPLIENNEIDNPGADYFVQKHIRHLFSQSEHIDTIILGCTHYPILQKKIEQFLPKPVTILSQGSIVANGLQDYLQRHPDMERRCSKGGTMHFLTTDSPENFDRHASLFYSKPVSSEHLELL
ncbi:MAG: glutamate racemase [Bacteroidetes bacterium]|nr:glutamate racemase [Bacteroidota bacterium]